MVRWLAGGSGRCGRGPVVGAATPTSAAVGGVSGGAGEQRGDQVLELVAVLFGGNAGVEADRDPARIGELAVPAHLRADRGPFGLDNAASARDLREDAF